MAVATRASPREDQLKESTDVDHRVLDNVARYLRDVQPTVLRTYVPASLLAECLTLATESNYLLSVDWALTTDGAIRLVFARPQMLEDASAQPRALGMMLAPTGTD